MSPPALEIRNLFYTWKGGATAALRGVSLTVAPGERLALVGPNGAGKSTLLAHLNGALLASPPILVHGVPVDRAHLREIRQRVGVVQQETDDQLFMPTVAEDVAFGPLNSGLSFDEVHARVTEALAKVGALALANRSHAALSGGERRRVAIATILSMAVSLVVLDEPTSNLDARGRRSVTEVLRGLTQTVIVATHDLALVRGVADRCAILDEGRIIADGPTEEVLADAESLERHGVV